MKSVLFAIENLAFIFIGIVVIVWIASNFSSFILWVFSIPKKYAVNKSLMSKILLMIELFKAVEGKGIKFILKINDVNIDCRIDRENQGKELGKLIDDDDDCGNGQ